MHFYSWLTITFIGFSALTNSDFIDGLILFPILIYASCLFVLNYSFDKFLYLFEIIVFLVLPLFQLVG